jgi:conjugal transfer pilin signal peptidase TrbI
MARAFAQRLPLALDELPRECNCLVILKTAVAGPTPHRRPDGAAAQKGGRAMNSEPVQQAHRGPGRYPAEGGESSNILPISCAMCAGAGISTCRSSRSGAWPMPGFFIDPTPRLPVLFNWTPSLPYRVAWLVHGPHPLQRGDYIVFSFDGEAQALPGAARPALLQDRARPAGRCRDRRRAAVAINGEEVGVAKTQAYDHSPLDPITPTVIPPGHYYVQGTSPDSFDSRYRDSGLVRAEQVVGVVVPLF